MSAMLNGRAVNDDATICDLDAAIILQVMENLLNVIDREEAGECPMLQKSPTERCNKKVNEETHYPSSNVISNMIRDRIQDDVEKMQEMEPVNINEQPKDGCDGRVPDVGEKEVECNSEDMFEDEKSEEDSISEALPLRTSDDEICKGNTDSLSITTKAEEETVCHSTSVFEDESQDISYCNVIQRHEEENPHQLYNETEHQEMTSESDNYLLVSGLTKVETEQNHEEEKDNDSVSYEFEAKNYLPEKGNEVCDNNIQKNDDANELIYDESIPPADLEEHTSDNTIQVTAMGQQVIEVEMNIGNDLNHDHSPKEAKENRSGEDVIMDNSGEDLKDKVNEVASCNHSEKWKENKFAISVHEDWKEREKGDQTCKLNGLCKDDSISSRTDEIVNDDAPTENVDGSVVEPQDIIKTVEIMINEITDKIHEHFCESNQDAKSYENGLEWNQNAKSLEKEKETHSGHRIEIDASETVVFDMVIGNDDDHPKENSVHGSNIIYELGKVNEDNELKGNQNDTDELNDFVPEMRNINEGTSRQVKISKDKNSHEIKEVTHSSQKDESNRVEVSKTTAFAAIHENAVTHKEKKIHDPDDLSRVDEQNKIHGEQSYIEDDIVPDIISEDDHVAMTHDESEIMAQKSEISPKGMSEKHKEDSPFLELTESGDPSCLPGYGEWHQNLNSHEKEKENCSSHQIEPDGVVITTTDALPLENINYAISSANDERPKYRIPRPNDFGKENDEIEIPDKHCTVEADFVSDVKIIDENSYQKDESPPIDDNVAQQNNGTEHVTVEGSPFFGGMESILEGTGSSTKNHSATASDAGSQESLGFVTALEFHSSQNSEEDGDKTMGTAEDLDDSKDGNFEERGKLSISTVLQKDVEVECKEDQSVPLDTKSALEVVPGDEQSFYGDNKDDCRKRHCSDTYIDQRGDANHNKRTRLSSLSEEYESSCFKWKYTPSFEMEDFVPIPGNNQDAERLPLVRPLPTGYKKSIKIGLSKKQKTFSLHPYYKKK